MPLRRRQGLEALTLTRRASLALPAAIHRGLGRDRGVEYIARVRVIVKVLDFVQFGGPKGIIDRTFEVVVEL